MSRYSPRPDSDREDDFDDVLIEPDDVGPAPDPLDLLWDSQAGLAANMRGWGAAVIGLGLVLGFLAVVLH
jgi:hypothetical protein